jgi:hypothetical protein
VSPLVHRQFDEMLRRFGDKHDRQTTHQRTVPVVSLPAWACLACIDALPQRAEGPPGLNAEVEHLAVRSHVPSLVPRKQLTGKVGEIQGCVLVQTVREAKRLRAVVAPRTTRNAGMDAPKPFRWRHLDFELCRYIGSVVRLVRNAKRVANEQAAQTTRKRSLRDRSFRNILYVSLAMFDERHAASEKRRLTLCREKFDKKRTKKAS